MIEDLTCQLMEEAQDDHELYQLLKENKNHLENKCGNKEVIRFFSEIAPFYEGSKSRELYEYLQKFKRHFDKITSNAMSEIKNEVKREGIAVFQFADGKHNRTKTLGLNQGEGRGREPYQVSEYGIDSTPVGHRLYRDLDTAIASESLLRES